MRKKMSLLGLSKKEVEAVKAGMITLHGIVVYPDCGCACWYEGYGGSTSGANGSANHAGGLYSPENNPRYD